MGQIHELQAEDPARPRWRVRLAALVLGVVGAFLGALALSALSAHPAGASTPPGPGVAPTVGVLSTMAQPAVAALPDGVDPESGAPGSSPAASPVVAPLEVSASTLHGPASAPTPALHGPAPVIEPSSRTISSPLGLVVATLASVPTSLTGSTALPFVQPPATSRADVVTDTTTMRPIGTTTGPSGNPPAFGFRPSPWSPRPLPAPARPFQSFPLVTTSSAAGDSSSTSGGSALAAAPASGPLLPDPLVSGVIPEQSGIPQFLFDLRTSPPG